MSYAVSLVKGGDVDVVVAFVGDERLTMLPKRKEK